MMTHLSATDLIRLLDLKPHPEGGFFRETYRSNDCTAIYFLLPKGHVSKLHRLRQDEIWHFYLGDPITIVEIVAKEVKKTTLGSEQRFQHLVRGGTWFGAYPMGEFSLVGCTVAPAFQFADFEMGSREKLLKEFPHAQNEILNLT